MTPSRLLPTVLVSILLLSPQLGHAQGCSMCRDTTAGSAPQARAGLRRAIPFLGIPAVTLFCGILVVGFRTKTRQRDDSE